MKPGEPVKAIDSYLRQGILHRRAYIPHPMGNTKNEGS